MQELIGRFLSFEEHLGRGLVKFVYYVLLFLLVVTTLYDLVVALATMVSVRFWAGLWKFLVVLPLRFFVMLLLLRVGAELVLAVLSIDDNLKTDDAEDDTISTGLNPVTAPKPAPTMKTAPADNPAEAANDGGEEGSEGETTSS